MTKLLSRREFLRAAAVSSAAVVLAACSEEITITPLISTGQSGSTPGASGAAATQPAVVLTPAAASTIPIQLMVSGWRGMLSQSMVNTWNKNNKAQVALVAGSGGFGDVDMASMIQTNIASDNQPWDGYATITAPWDTANWVTKDVIIPLDDLIKTSSTSNAGLVVPAIMPGIKEAISYEGKIYGIPTNVGSTAFYYSPTLLADAGYNQVPQTWDDIYTAAAQVKSQNADVNPFISTSTPLTDLWFWMWGAMEKPIDADGLIDIRSPEAMDALAWLRRMVDEDLMFTFRFRPDDNAGDQGGGGGGQFRRSTAMLTAQDSYGNFMQLNDGEEEVKPEISYGLVARQGAANAGVPFWINLCVVLKKGKNPQGMVDFYLWLFGPDNKDMGKQIAQDSPKPCYAYTYTEFVQTDPALAWEQTGIDLIAKSTWFPTSSSHSTEESITRTYIQNVLDTDKQFTRSLATQEMQAAYDEIKAALKL
jgi:ABC-type glycerol-3-phosphate transport system substrate-binding protein